MERPDICYVVYVLSQFMHSLKISHMEAATRVVKYVKNAPGLGVLKRSRQSTKLTAFYDAD